MCGIAGIINFNGKPVDEAQLKTMTGAVAHRGPDGEGLFVDGCVGMGHRRLSIFDLSDAGRQPMKGWGCTITYNGAIYNFPEIKVSLEEKGYQFSTRSDTEVILASYHCWGADCLKRFHGMWAFAIYDEAKQEVFLSRDRFGEKPLYYIYNGGNSFQFASTISSLRTLGQPVTINPAMVARYLVHAKSEHHEETFYEEINKLPAGHYLIIGLQDQSVKKQRFYTLEQASPSLYGHNFQQQLDELITRSINEALRADVEVGTCLSGGIDSSVIAALAAKRQHAGNLNFRAYTAGLAEAEKDERSKAEKVAKQLNVDWYPTLVTDAWMQKHFSEVLDAQEEPFISPSVLMQFAVMKLARHHGQKILLDGQGADEIFLGYQTHLAWALRSNPIAIASQALYACKNYDISLWELCMLWGYFGETALQLNHQISRWPSLPSHVQELLRQEAKANVEYAKQGFLHQQMQELTQGNFIAMLRYEDKNAMHFGIETRLPFLNHNLVEWAMSLPLTCRISKGWSKYLLRSYASRILPDDIAWRKGKIGFEGGSEKWIGDLYHNKPALHDTQLRQWLQSHQPKNASMQWRILMIHYWSNAENVYLN